MSLASYMERVFPIESFDRLVSLQLVPIEDDEGHEVLHSNNGRVTLRIVTWGGASWPVWKSSNMSHERYVTNIFEQPTWIVPTEILLTKSGELDRPWRTEMYIQAWGHVVREALSGPGDHGNRLPWELTTFRRHPMALSNAITTMDYVNALRVKTRLGRFIR